MKVNALDKQDMYSLSEERFNALTHALGALLSITALIVLIVKAVDYGSAINVVGVTIFGISLVLMYTASSFYHGVKSPKWKRRLRQIDHLNIFILIAGTYTPIALISLNGPYGWVIFSILWGVALVGLFYKLFFFGDGWLSSALYVIMGWVALGFVVQIVSALPSACLMWIVLGGILYTSGVIFYMVDEKIEYCHLIWHLFVLAGSIAHFFAIYLYIAPMKIP